MTGNNSCEIPTAPKMQRGKEDSPLLLEKVVISFWGRVTCLEHFQFCMFIADFDHNKSLPTFFQNSFPLWWHIICVRGGKITMFIRYQASLICGLFSKRKITNKKILWTRIPRLLGPKTSYVNVLRQKWHILTFCGEKWHRFTYI